MSWCIVKFSKATVKERHDAQLRESIFWTRLWKNFREHYFIVLQTFFCRNQAPCTLRRRNLKTGALLWQRIKCFPSTLRRRNLNTGHFGFASEENSVKEIPWLSWCDRFRKASFSKSFPSTRQQNDGVFKFLWFENCFRKPPFLWRISVDGRPNRRNKAAFSNFSGLKSVFVPD